MLNNITGIFNNIGKFCGLNVPAEKGYSSIKELDKYIERSTDGAVPVTNYLNYDYYDSESELFFNEGNTSGFMIEIAPIVGARVEIEKNLNSFFNIELPPKSHIQFLLVASHNIDSKIDLWKRDRFKSGDEMIDKITMYRESFLRERARDFSSTDGRMGRSFRAFVSYSKKLGAKYSGTKDVLAFKHKLFQKFETLTLCPRICNAEDLIFVVGDLMQPELRARKYKKYDPVNSLSDQALKILRKVTVEGNSLKHVEEGLVTRCFYPAAYPEYFSLVEMIDLLGSEQPGMSIPARFVISYSLATDIDRTGQENTIARGMRAAKASEQSYTKRDTNLKEEVGEWTGIIHRYKNGERLLTECMLVTITAPSSEIDIAEEAIKSLYNSKDWRLEVNQYMQLPSILSVLPMQQARFWRMLKNTKLVRLVMSKEVVAKLPIHGEWKGARGSGVLLLGRRGEMFNWNPFYRVGGAGNFNVCVMAPAGGGKSVFLEELTTSLLAQDTSVFILDIGASYQNICEVVGGENIRFNNTNNLSLNPFAGLAGNGYGYVRAAHLLKEGRSIDEVCALTGLSSNQIELYIEGLRTGSSNEEQDNVIEILKVGDHYVNKDSIIYAKQIIAAMCGITGNAHAEGVLEKAVTEGIERFGNELDITKFSEILKGFTEIEIAKTLSETLYPYTEKGIHGKYFKSGETATFRSRLTVIEFEEIKNDKVLFNVILQIIMMQITSQFMCGDRSKQFAIIVDEAWSIMDFSASFLEVFARIVRKYGGSLITCVQDLASFYKGAPQKAIIENSSWKVILKQTSTDSFEMDGELKKIIPLIASVTKEPGGKYSEMLIHSSGLSVVGRLVLDPYSVALYSTEKDDFNFLYKCKNAGMSTHEAVMELSKKYGKLPDIENLVKNPKMVDSNV